MQAATGRTGELAPGAGAIRLADGPDDVHIEAVANLELAKYRS